MNSGIKQSWLGEPLLIVATLVWGSAVPVCKDLLSELQPSQIMLLRFSLAFILLSPLAWLKRGEYKRAWLRPGLICGAMLTMVFSLAMTSVKYTSATRTGFLFSLFVVVVPVLSYLIYRQKPGWPSLAGAALALTGSWFFTNVDNRPKPAL